VWEPKYQELSDAVNMSDPISLLIWQRVMNDFLALIKILLTRISTASGEIRTDFGKTTSVLTE
jgi:hypothetical protein